MKEITAELRRRATGTWVKDRTKEMVVEKSHEVKDRLLVSPLFHGLVGGLATAFASTLVRRYFDQRNASYDETSRYRIPSSGDGYYGQGYIPDERSPADLSSGYSTGTSGVTSGSTDKSGSKDEAGIVERASAKATEIKDHLGESVHAARESATDKIGDIKDRAGAAIKDVRERLPSTDQIKERVSSVYTHAVEEQPLALLFGATALGAALGLFVPVSRSERQLMEPVRRRVREEIEAVGDTLEEKIDEVGGKLQESIGKTEAKPDAHGPVIH